MLKYSLGSRTTVATAGAKVECQPWKCKALSSIPSTTESNNNNKRLEENSFCNIIHRIKFILFLFSFFWQYWGLNLLCAVWKVVGRCRGSLPSQATELAREAACEPKLVYEVGFIREKGKATAKQCSRAWKLVAPWSGEGWGFYECFNSGFG
jgi:hypothetical protein